MSEIYQGAADRRKGFLLFLAHIAGDTAGRGVVDVRRAQLALNRKGADCEGPIRRVAAGKGIALNSGVTVTRRVTERVVLGFRSSKRLYQ